MTFSFVSIVAVLSSLYYSAKDMPNDSVIPLCSCRWRSLGVGSVSAAGHHHHGRDALQQHHAAIGRHVAGALPLAPIGSVPGGRGQCSLSVT